MDSPVNFEPYNGDCMGLHVDENHYVIRWSGPGVILFSFSRRGDAISAHFASNKEGLRYIKQAIDDFVTHVFWVFDWCTMVLAQVKRSSVGRMIEKCGFMPVAQADEYTVYMRHREWAE